MRFTDVRIRGMGCFRDEVFVDFTKLHGDIIAVWGPVGAGKSSLLELLGGSIYRTCPTRGSLKDFANTRDAFCEVGVVNGQPYRIRQTVDCISGQGETLITNGDGRPVLESTKVSAADKYIAQHLASSDVLYASTFAVQGSAGFLGLEKAEKKSVILKALGVDRLERLAKTARERAVTTKSELDVLRGRIADEEQRASDPEQVAAMLDGLRREEGATSEAVGVARGAYDQALAAEQLSKLAAREVEAYTQRRAELVAQLERATREAADIEARVAKNRGVMGRGDEIRAAQERATAIDAELAALDEPHAQARIAHANATNERAALERQAKELKQRRVGVATRIARAERAVAERAKVEKAVADLPGMRVKLAEYEAKHTALCAELDGMQSFAMDTAGVRIGALRKTLQHVCDLDPMADVRVAIVEANDGLVNDNETAKRADESPAVIQDLRKRVEVASGTEREWRSMVGNAELIAMGAAAIEQAAADLEQARCELVGFDEDAEVLDDGIELAAEASAAALAEQTRINGLAVDLRSERDKLVPIITLAERHAQAEARLAELEPRLAAVREEAARATDAIAQLGDMPTMAPTADVEGSRRALEAHEATLRSLEAKVAVTRAQLSDAKASRERLASFAAKRRVLEEDHADWTRLGDDLGKDGLQSLIVDCVGPELTEVANDYLHEAFGPRFSVRIDTTRRASDGKRDLEAFDIQVLDSEKGREGGVETYSGGEKVILGEGISLAIATLSIRRSGIRGAMLVRDESGAALDVENGRRYINMLRRAAKLMDASTVLFVSHSAELAAMADSRIEIRDGKVEVVS